MDDVDVAQRGLAVVGSSGRIIGTTLSDISGLNERPEIRRALLRGSACDGAVLIDGHLYFTSAAPIVYANQMIIGAVWVAEPFRLPVTDDDASFGVIVMSGNNLVASSLGDEEEQALGSVPATDPRATPIGRAGPVEIMQRGERVLAGIPTVLREPASDGSPPLTAMVIVEADLVPVSWASFQDRLVNLDLLDRRLWAVASSGLLLFLLSLAIVSLDGRLLRRRVDRTARESEAERLQARVFEPEPEGRTPVRGLDTPSLSSLRDSASARQTGSKDKPPRRREEPIENPKVLSETASITREQAPKKRQRPADPTPAAQVIKRIPSGSFPKITPHNSEPLFPPTPSDFTKDESMPGIESPFGSGFGDDSEEMPLIQPEPSDPMLSLDPGPTARPDWLLNTDGKKDPERRKIPPITVPVESTGRDKVLKELLGEDTGPLNTEADSSPAPYELTADTFLDESAENTAADPYYELFKEFLAARKQCGLDVDHLEFGDFQDKVLKKEADFKSRHMCDSVVLEVFVKDGKVGLKARPA